MRHEQIKTKQHALVALQNITNSYMLGLLLIMNHGAINWSALGESRYTASVNGFVVEAELAPFLRGVKSLVDERPVAVEQYLGMLLRAAVAEAHEAVMHYCNITDQFQTYRDQPWFQFARILRNTTSHKQGGTIDWPADLTKAGVKSVNWRHLTFTPEMHGTGLELGEPGVLQFLADLREFAEAKLK